MHKSPDNSGVYIISPANSPEGPCKIGFARNAIARLGALQVGNHLALELCSVWCSAHISVVEIERRMHAMHASKHIRGEWFDVSVAAAESSIALLDDAQAFDKSEDNAAMLLCAMAYHPRWNA